MEAFTSTLNGHLKNSNSVHKKVVLAVFLERYSDNAIQKSFRHALYMSLMPLTTAYNYLLQFQSH